MTDVKRLLDKATPLPWRLDPGPEYDPTDWVILGGPDGKYWVTNLEGPDAEYRWATNSTALLQERIAVQGSQTDGELIVHAVNHLPDYEAAVEALERLIRGMERRGPAEGRYCAWSDEEHATVEDARAALSRLRDEVPA